mmetsp:Transcript_16276/g.33085  ORF Transcript_16276/g.33085 Transcript_16276/m.33085 type:complete len:342 (-) Transcript_16276:355-1380(-)
MTTIALINQNELELETLQPWVSSKTYEWIRGDDKKRADFQKEMDDAPSTNFFDNDSDDDINNFPRVQEWRSSLNNPDGIGGYNSRSGRIDEETDDGSVKVVFILSESYAGFGDTLWSSSRHIANQLANPTTCRNLIAPVIAQNEEEKSNNQHPLLGRSFVELGAGAGVPSWTAMRCGARVVSTDIASPNRIRCMAESIEKNIQLMKLDGVPMHYAEKTKACPNTWGTTDGVEDVKLALNRNGEEKFQILVAADCCYMPWLHSELLDTIDKLLAVNGVALIPFCLHDNTKDEEVWGIVEMAKQVGFHVEHLEDVQLTPPKTGMDDKQGLVHTLRLTRVQSEV